MKINLAIDCIESTAIDTLTTLHSFLARNRWFDGKVYLMTINPSSLSQKTISNVSSIYENFEVVDCSINPILFSLSTDYSSNLDAQPKILSLLSFFIPEEKILFISSSCLFLKNINGLLGKGSLSFPINESNERDDSFFYRSESIRLRNIKGEFKNFIETESSICSLLSSSPESFSNILCERSSNYKDKIFIKRKSRIGELDAVKYDTIRSDAKISTRINQLWLQHRNIVFNILKRPSLVKVKSLSQTFYSSVPAEANKVSSKIINKNKEEAPFFPKVNPPSQTSLSIIIPAHKAESYIEDCLNSIDSKYLNNIEILLGIDNCESTLNKIISIKNKYENLRVFFSNKSVGPYLIRNSLTSYAKYDNFLFFDADDIMKENIFPYLKRYFNSDYIVRFKYLDFSDGSNHLTLSKLNKSVAHGVFFIPKKVFDQIGGFQSWKMGADTEFMKRSEVNKIHTVKIDTPLFYRRVHSNSLTQNPSTNHNSPERIRIKNWIKHNTDWMIPISKQTVNLTEVK